MKRVTKGDVVATINSTTSIYENTKISFTEPNSSKWSIESCNQSLINTESSKINSNLTTILTAKETLIITLVHHTI